MADQSRPTKRRQQKFSLPWHESIVFRAAAIAGLILLCGYLVSIYFGIQSIDAIARLAHDPETEKSLTSQLDQIKSVQSLRQQLIAERLAEEISDHPKDKPVTSEVVGRWISDATEGLDVDPSELVIEDNPSSAPVNPPTWAGRSRLDFLNYSVTFPKGNLYRTFKNAEEIVQRYQLVGVELDSNIRPTLMRANTLVLVAGFCLLTFAFLILARRFRQNVLEILQGFEKWSLGDTSFLFQPTYTGELRLITQQFNAMAKDIEANRQKTLYLEKIASWQVIARKLAHEIKNPLTPIQMMVAQLQRRYKGDDQEFVHLLQDAQVIISEEVAGLRRMVDNFSNFARLPVPTFSQVDLVRTIRHVLELQKPAYPQHQFGYSGNVQDYQITADDGLLKQVLINLTKNAAEACVEPAMICISIQDAGEDLFIHVADNGPGIPEDIRKRVFEAYFTTKHTGPSPGMGLGLAICQKIILDHRGEITVQSKPGETIFSIRLPKTQQDGRR